MTTLDPARAAVSSVHGRVIFVLATPETGAERLLPALGCLPGVVSAGVPTHLFSQGLGTLLDTWLTRMREALGDRADDARFLGDARLLADTPLASRLASAGADRVVEYTPDHIGLAGLIMAVYPDAQFVHVVGDGRRVAARLASPLLLWPPFLAARRWCDDQRVAIDLDGQPNLHTLRIEDVLEDPVFFLGELGARIGVDAPDKALQSAAAAVGGAGRPVAGTSGGRVAALVEVLGGDVLSFYGYEYREPTRARRLAAQAELGAIGEVAWAVRAAIRRARSARQED